MRFELMTDAILHAGPLNPILSYNFLNHYIRAPRYHCAKGAVFIKKNYNESDNMLWS